MPDDDMLVPAGLDDLFPALLLPEGTGLPVLAWARDLFKRELGLALPPMPRELAADARALAQGLVTSRTDGLGPYVLRPFLDELDGSPAPYILFGAAGHGADSWAMHYYLVQARLGLFIQLRFGGAYGDLERERERLASTFAVAESLILAPGLRSLPEGQRLVVVESELAGSRWGVIGQRAGGLEPVDDPLARALAWLEGAAEPAADAAPGLAEAPPWPIWG